MPLSPPPTTRRRECAICCPDRVYELMRGCWNWEPDNRPAFEEIHYAMENMFQESSITEEVERQLKSFASSSNTPNAVPTPQLPSKKPRHQGQNSSSTSRNKAEPLAQTPPTSASSTLSTFGNRNKQEQQPCLSPAAGAAPSTPSMDPLNQGIVSTKSTVVQLRRGTNKQGRQAPTPPRRTSSFRDSMLGEGEEGEDEDAVDQGYVHDEFAEADEDLAAENDPTALPPPPPNTSTFLPNPTASKSKPRPMGSKTPQDVRKSSKAPLTPKEGSTNSPRSSSSHRRRHREQHRHDTAEDSGAAPVQVGALDERNLRRAVHRYGTMPKGARIGAYLESLRVSGLTPEPPSSSSDNTAPAAVGGGHESDSTLDNVSSAAQDTLERPPSLQAAKQQQQHLIRSNSSHGSFGAAPRQTASSRPCVSPVPPPPLAQTSSSHPRRALPPHHDIMSQSIPSNKKHNPLPPPPPLDENGENLPDRLARSSRFSRNTKEDESKSPLSPESERSRTLGSPAVGSLDDSPSSGTKDLTGDHQQNSQSDAIRPYRAVKTTLQEPEQLNKRPLDTPGSLQAAQLVSELADSLKTKSATATTPVNTTPKVKDEEDKSHEIDFRANLRKVSNSNTKQENTNVESSTNPHEIDFKASLRKRSTEESSKKKEDDSNQNQEDSGGIVDFKARLRKPRSPEKTPNVQESSAAEDGTVDFKARLRKVSGNKPVVTVGVAPSSNSKNKNKSEEVEKVKDAEESSVPTNGVGVSEEKRKSTGSISSLRKMWESTDGEPKAESKPTDTAATVQSPMSPTHASSNLPGESPATPVKPSVVKFEKRVWPPVPSTENTEKPMVPVKPTVKPTSPVAPAPAPSSFLRNQGQPPPRPRNPPPPTSAAAAAASTRPPTARPPPPKPFAGRLPLSNIYASPTPAATAYSVSPSMTGAKPAVANKPPLGRKPNRDVGSSDSGVSSDRESLLALSQSLEEQLKPSAAAGDQQLRDSVDSLHAGCVAIIDTVPATGRFRFRTLLNRLDEQARELNPGVRADDRLIGDLRGTVREVTAVLQR